MLGKTVVSHWRRGISGMHMDFPSSDHHEICLWGYTPWVELPLGTLRNEHIKQKTLISLQRARCWPAGRWTLTIAAVVIHQDDLLEQVWWCALHGWVDGPQQHRECLIDEDEHDAHLWQAVRKWEVSAPGKKNDGTLGPAGDTTVVTPGMGPPPNSFSFSNGHRSLSSLQGLISGMLKMGLEQHKSPFTESLVHKCTRMGWWPCQLHSRT